MKNWRQQFTPNILLWTLLFAWWVINLLQAGFTELANDEAYYWMFSQNLDWGYFDHPPITALLVRLGSFLGGTLGIRFFFTLLQPLYLYILYRLIKPSQVTLSDVSLYVIICAGLPILQLYGFIAVPDGPLMFFCALFLLSFKLVTEKNRWCDALLMGLAIGALAYSKYQGALVVIFALLAYPRILKSPKFYFAVVVAAITIVPHIIWQYNHDWVSFKYHLSDRNANFRLDYFIEYLLNIVAIFNPLFFPLYIRRWIKAKSENPTQRAIYTITIGFILFFLLSSLRGYVQPQWIIPSTFGMILLLWRMGLESPKVRKYVVISGLITIGLAGLFRIEMVFNPLKIKYEIFDNKETYGQIAQLSRGKTVIFMGGYARAAKYQYYTGQKAYCQASAYGRSSQWQFRDDDTRAIGDSVIMETRAEIAQRTLSLANGKTFSYNFADNFQSTRMVKIDFMPTDIGQQPQRGEKLTIVASIENPYPYQIKLNRDTQPIVMVLKISTLYTIEILADFPLTMVAPNGLSIVKMEFTLPLDMKPGKYKYGLTIVTPNVDSWYNSKSYKIEIK